jgi:hypothetical protein
MSGHSVTRAAGPGLSANNEGWQRRSSAFPRISREFRAVSRALREVREWRNAMLRRMVRAVDTRIQLRNESGQLRARLATVQRALLSDVTFSGELISLHMRAMG